jgi:hypothetical protein
MNGASVTLVALSVLVLLGVPWSAVAGLADDVPIQANVASHFVGKEMIVDGIVTAAQRDGNTVHLRLGNDPQDLTVSLILSLLNNFPAAPERYYLGKTVRVGGMIRSFRGVPEMVIRDQADIQVLGSGSPSLADRPGASAGKPGEESDLRQRVESLGERVQHLEERLQQLEQPRSDAQRQ